MIHTDSKNYIYVDTFLICKVYVKKNVNIIIVLQLTMFFNTVENKNIIYNLCTNDLRSLYKTYVTKSV